MTPSTFEASLQLRCGSDYRLRQSPRTGLWNIEQQVGRGVWETPEGDPDAAQRLKDGYALVMQFAPEPRMKCPSCGFYLAVPVLKIAEVRCSYCVSQGEKEMFFVGYFPLCEKLLERLERTHPRRRDAWQRELASKNASAAKAQKRTHDTNLEALIYDRYHSLVRTPRTYLSDHRTY